MKIDRFEGEFRFLSNFYPSRVRLGDDEFEDIYRTVEHAFQAAKTLNPKERKRIREAETPEEAKRIGGSVQLRPAWDEIKLNVMRDLLWEKFSEYSDLRAKLLATNDAEIVEGNTWGDLFWGVDSKTGEGENHLGRLLMETREKIREQTAAVLFAKRVAPELDLFVDMLKRASVLHTKEARQGNVVVSVPDKYGEGSVDITFSPDGHLLSLEGYGY